MSELTQCNYCSFEALKRHARQDKQRVVVLSAKREDKYFMGGVDVYRFPKSVMSIPQFKKLTHKQQQAWWVCWFMELGTTCCC